MLTSEDLQQIRTIVADTVADAVTAAEDRLTGKMRGIETNLLTAFHSYAKGQTARFHTVESTNADLLVRMAALEDRMLNLETRR